MSCQNKQKQIGLALHNYHDSNNAFPPGQPRGFYTSNWYSDPNAGKNFDYDRSCWAGYILPYIEQNALYTQYQAGLTAKRTTYTDGYRTTITQSFVCPSDPTGPKVSALGQGFHTNYIVCAGNGYFTPSADPAGTNLNGMFYGFSKVTLTSVTDGTTNTVMVSELLNIQDTTAHDIRGRIWNSVHAGTEFSTIYTPNSTIGDNPMGYCVNTLPRAPCASGSVLNSYTLAR